MKRQAVKRQAMERGDGKQTAQCQNPRQLSKTPVEAPDNPPGSHLLDSEQPAFPQPLQAPEAGIATLASPVRLSVGMQPARSLILVLVVLIAVVPLGGCLYRTRAVAVRTTTGQVQTATLDELVERINAQVTNVQTLKATVGIVASVGGNKSGKVTEYEEIRGYILARKPSSLRMTGLFPILQNRLFDMVSSAQEFRLWIPSKNRFIVGNNIDSNSGAADDDAVTPSARPLENLRPQVIYDALLLQSVDPQNEVVVLEEGEHMAIDPVTRKPVLQPDYTLDIIELRPGGQGSYLARKDVFDRTDLQPHQQISYDDHGSVVTDVHYDEYREFDGVLFPTTIKIWRPQQEYSIKLAVTKLTINGPIMDNQFVLEPPTGASVASR
jgi:outer membrane lipoprotein-sorting protein